MGLAEVGWPSFQTRTNRGLPLPGRESLLPDVLQQSLVDAFLAVLVAGGVSPEPFDNVLVQLERYLLLQRLVERPTDGFGPVDWSFRDVGVVGRSACNGPIDAVS